MKLLNVALPLVALISAIMMAAPLFAMPTNLTTATGLTTPINATMGLDERGQVPLWICSWKLGEGSPANYHYGKWCDASREDDRTGIVPVWHCNDRSRNWVADMGQIPINHGILRFSESLAVLSSSLPLLTPPSALLGTGAACVSPMSAGKTKDYSPTRY